jgi:hypothetical protein
MNTILYLLNHTASITIVIGGIGILLLSLFELILFVFRKNKKETRWQK